MAKAICLIPAVTILGAVLPACGEPILGDWNVTQYGSKVLPKSYTSDGSTYTKTISIAFEADLDVDFTKTKTTTGIKTGVKSYRYTGSWVRSGSTYNINTEFYRTALTCTIEAGELECDDTSGDRVIDAVRAD